MEKYSKPLEDFLSFLRQCSAELAEAIKTEELTDKQTQDILHHMELEDNTPFDYICEGIALTDIRNKRREAKDRRKILSPVVEWTETNQKTVNMLTQILGKVRKEEQSAAAVRYYIDRTDIVEKILEDNDRI